MSGGPAGALPGRRPDLKMRMFHRVLQADLEAVRQALIDMQDRFDGHASSDALGRIELVLAEVLNNIVHHGAGLGKDAAPGSPPLRPVVIHLTVTRHEGGLACAVSDNGSPLPPECLIGVETLPPSEAAALRGGGFGWFIIRDLTQSLFYFREDDRNFLCFNIPRQGPGRRHPRRRNVA